MPNTIRPFVTAALAYLTATACSAEQTTRPNSSAQQKWNQWVKEYDSSRRSADGWLSLAGLFWLSEGDNSIGSANEMQHRFPASAPAHLGTISVFKNGRLRFIRNDKHVLIDKQDIDEQELVINDTVVSVGTYSFYIIERERGFAIRLKDSANPAISNYSGTQFHPYSNSWTIPARLIKHATPETMSIPTVYETVRESESAGWLEFEFQGKMRRLQAVSYGKETPMSLMFADTTNQTSTYGAGRFLAVEWPRNGDMTTIDFNWAYNPPCSITPYATCPLPPQQNRLPIAVTAGELYEQKAY